MEIDHGRVRSAASGVRASAEGVSPHRVGDAAAAGAAAVPGYDLAAALSEVGDRLASRLVAFNYALQGWADEVDAAVAAYQETDCAASDRVSRLTWSPV